MYNDESDPHFQSFSKLPLYFYSFKINQFCAFTHSFDDDVQCYVCLLEIKNILRQFAFTDFLFFNFQVFKEMGQDFGLIELDETQDGSSMQSYLSQLTGASSVRLCSRTSASMTEACSGMLSVCYLQLSHL